MRPARAKALIINAFALAGRFAIFNPYTQGAALGYVLIGLSARIIEFWHALLFCLKSKVPIEKCGVSTKVPLEKCNHRLQVPLEKCIFAV